MNRVHDVAVVQAALKYARAPGARSGFWTGRIDGKMSAALEGAIAAFQKATRTTTTGRMGNAVAETNRLEGLLPSTHKQMRAMAGTTSIWRTPGRNKRVAEVVKSAEQSPFPRDEKSALVAITKRAAQSFGLGLELTNSAVTADGRFRASLGVPGLEWLDPNTGRFNKAGSAPISVVRSLSRIVQGNAAWRAETQPREALLELLSMRVINALKGPPVLDVNALELFDLKRRPAGAVAQACIAGCARMASPGTRGGTPIDTKDFEAMLAALDSPEPDIAAQMRDTGIPGFTNEASTQPIPPLSGTIFFGGAGMTGTYADDFVRLLEEVGVQGVSGADPNDWSTGGLAGDAWHSATNRERDGYYTDFTKIPSKPSDQFNLIGYSYGATLAANIALDYADAGGNVDHVILIGAPIGSSLLASLREHENVARVVVEDLAHFGDKVRAGQTDAAFWGALIQMGPDLLFNESVYDADDPAAGHFYYSEPGPIGTERRRELVERLVDGFGLQ